jgi:dGTPase
MKLVEEIQQHVEKLSSDSQTKIFQYILELEQKQKQITENNWQEERQEKLSSDDKRDNYARDRARIIHSACFRRLQGKTQVLGLGESDFYRTRLTHSIEVAQIASGIADYLRTEEYYKDYKYFIPQQNLIEAIGLAHDIGHPPFGHGGEYALNYCMREFGGFEGNAQTLRICTQLGEYSEKNGLNLTRRTLLGLIKYPAIYENVVNIEKYDNKKAPLCVNSFKPPKFNFFGCDIENFNWIMQGFSKKDSNRFKEMGKTDGHGKTIYKSFDCSIMELADDIAYGVHDLEDAIALRFITEKDWDDIKEKIKNYFSDYPYGDITKDLFSGKNRTRKIAISYLVHHFVKKCQIRKKGKFDSDLLDLEAFLPEEEKEQLKTLKDFVVTKVIKSPEVQTLEYKGQQMIIRLFEVIANNPIMLERKHYEKYEREPQKEKQLRIICDYIAGTTDDYATRLYHKIFTPSNGSIFDKL